jgi:FkbM family methyltransferase|tara:strand:+ start:1304 stop:2056 length:753 start_codon:yes stop_codon:yes gene_type:complete
MRFKFNKKIEFFLKKNFLPQSYLFEKRIKRSIKNNDEKELQLLKKIIIPETDTIDIGVYRGVYSYEMAKYSKMVHAFEPNPIIFKDIELNLSKIIKNINLYNFALSDKENKVLLKVPIRNKNYDKSNYEEYFQMGRATIHEQNVMGDIETFEIKSKKLDNFTFSNRISFIKIDVEGHEMSVIKGAENTIKQYKPTLLVEIEEKHSKQKVLDSINYINSLGYESFFYDNELKSTNNLNNLNMYNNFIFKPC